MSVLDVCTKVARKVGIKVPSSIYGSTERTNQSLGDLANEMARQIAFDSGHDWTLLKQTGTITGDGSTLDWDLPVDYRRMQKDHNLWPSDRDWDPLTPVPSYNTWLAYEVTTFVPLTGYWNLHRGQLHIKPAIVAAATVKYPYVSNIIVHPAEEASPDKRTFDDDGDRFMLLSKATDYEQAEDLLRLAMVWKWKENNGQAYAGDLNDFEVAKSRAITDDKGGAPILQLNRRSAGVNSLGMTFAWPGTIVP